MWRDFPRVVTNRSKLLKDLTHLIQPMVDDEVVKMTMIIMILRMVMSIHPKSVMVQEKSR